MKKISIILSAIALVLSSCSKSDSPDVIGDPVDTTNILLTKIKTSQGTTVVNTATNIYNGKKLVEIVQSNFDKTTYSYTGDLITKIQEYSGTSLDVSETFTYNTDAKLESYIKVDYNPIIGTTPIGFKVIYTYDSLGNINYITYNGTATVQTTQGSTGKATLTNGSITKLERNYTAIPFGAAAYTQTQIITYDDKINPGNNIVGFYKITLQGTDIGLSGSTHNILKITSNNGTYNTSIDESTYTYNTNNYPVTEINVSKGFNASGAITITNTFSNEYTY